MLESIIPIQVGMYSNINLVLIFIPIDAQYFRRSFRQEKHCSILFIRDLASTWERLRFFPKQTKPVSKGFRFLPAGDAQAKTTELFSTASQNAICEITLNSDSRERARVKLRVSLKESVWRPRVVEFHRVPN